MPKRKIFISYRRDDLIAKGLVGRIHDRLASRFGEANVFLDEQALQPGAVFPQVLRDTITSSDLVLAIIGPQWLEILNARSDDSRDFLRTELETALEHRKTIIPLLLAEAEMPSKEKLPLSLVELANINARRLDPGRDFNRQMQALIEQIEGPSRRRALATIAVAGVTAAGVAGAYLGRLPNLLSGKRDSARLSTLVIMGENVAYEREIVRGFSRRLEEGLRSRGITQLAHPDVVPKFVGTYASPNSEAGKETWKQVVEDIKSSYVRGSIDYFVTIGSFASLAIKQSNLIYDLEAQGMIYLGVTDPGRAGLEGQYKIAGVRYGTGGIDYGRKISELFAPDQRLVFVYQDQEGNIQDRAIAADLEKLNQEFAVTEPSFRKPRFEIRPIDGLIDVGKLKLADRNMPSASEVYFAWYGLDNILSQENKSSLHDPSLWIVPSTYSEKNLNLAGVIVTVDDAVVGSLGADMILARIDEPSVPLERMPVGRPGFRVWIKRDALERKGLRLTEAALNRQNIPGYSYR